ncbi:MAG TPA: glycosyltransferase family 87 protein [Thermohalobaculum sp.]|nr:glycosyltransferase family 87 protein [Thermohalobaculum sp.]
MTLDHPLARRLGRILAGLALLGLAAYAGSVVLVINSAEFEADSLMIDFTAFWGAARLAVEGQALAAFQPALLEAAQGARDLGPYDAMPWLYPPGYLALIAPLGLLPFSAALILFGAASAAAFLLAIRPLAVPGALPWLLAAPATLLSLALGNNGLLSAACIAAALTSLGRGDQRQAGLWIAALTLKPSLGLLIPPVLLAARQWRAFGWAAAGTVAIAALSTAVFGAGYWPLFLQSLAEGTQRMEGGNAPLDRMITWYGFLRTAGLPHGTALAGQAASSLAAIAAVALLWSRRAAPFELKAAAFCFALPLATPYAYLYEMTFGLLGMLFLLRWRAGWHGSCWALMAVLWFVPAIGLVTAGALPVALFAAPLMSLILVLTLRQALRPAAA